MALLLIIKNTGPDRGNVTSIIPQDQYPGSMVAENAHNQWAFIYTQGSVTISDFEDLLDPKMTDYESAKESVPLFERTKIAIKKSKTFETYLDFNDNSSYKISINEINNAKKNR